MKFWNNIFGSSQSKVTQRSLRLEGLESRNLLSASPMPVLLVIADQQDFYYREYNDTRNALLDSGVPVTVAATTTNPSRSHVNTGEVQAGASGFVVPDIALANVRSSDYSAIAFVGGWGASMYQYAYNDPNFDGVTDNFYWNSHYNGDTNLNDGVIASQKVAVNDLINEFLAADKPVAGICHGVTVLAWARVDGVSPLAGRQVSVPLTVGSPNQYYAGADRVYPYSSGQYDQVVANGGLANTMSGQYGQPNTVADDVVVDGRIITAENYDSATYFGQIIAREVLASLPPSNHAPQVSAANWMLAENATMGSAVGTVSAIDPDAGQSLTYAIVGGNSGGAFAINPTTGAVSVANTAALDFEATPVFQLTVLVTDNGSPALDATGQIVINLTDVFEPATLRGGSLMLMGTAANDTIYVWSNATANSVSAWINGTHLGPFQLGPTGHVKVFAGAGNDQVFATDLRAPLAAFGGTGHDLITAGTASSLLDGGDGVDRLYGGIGADLIVGGAGDDQLKGNSGDDVIVGGDGNDFLEGLTGRDILIGGMGIDCVRGGDGEDLLIGGSTSYDQDIAALNMLAAIWSSPGDMLTRTQQLSGLTAAVQDDGAQDCLWGGLDADWLFALGADKMYSPEASDHITRCSKIVCQRGLSPIGFH